MTVNRAWTNSGTPADRQRCMVIMDRVPGGQFTNVRKPPSGLLGLLRRAEERLVRDIRPETQYSSHIRGVGVAIDYLVQALLEHSHVSQFAFAVPDTRRREFDDWSKRHLNQTGKLVDIHPVTQLLRNGVRAIAPDIWLNVHGDIPVVPRIREMFSHRVYPIVTVQHGLSTHSLLYDRFLKTMLTTSYDCDSLVCTSRACQKALSNILAAVSSSFNKQFGTNIGFNGRLDIIPLCVDTDQLRPGDKSAFRKHLHIPQDSTVLLYIGYLAQVKADLAPLLPMIKRLVNDNPADNLLFLVAGTGPESYGKALLSLVQEIGLTKTVVLMREVSDGRKEELLRAADIFVAPCDSMQESFGLTPVEAMACGLPQVVADWDGYRDTVVDGETGFLVPTCWGRFDGNMYGTCDMLGWFYDHAVQAQSIVLDISCMQNRLQQLIANRELRAAMSERSRARAVAEFSFANIARRYDELWVDLRAMASKSHPVAKVTSFDQPAYFDFFGHFATKELSNEWRVQKAEESAFSFESVLRVAQAELPGIPLLDGALVTEIARTLSAAQTASQPLTVGQLVATTITEEWSPDTIRRHILFMLKHGILTV
jgi:D-inositol-3-phosphate glycosyltransferase